MHGPGKESWGIGSAIGVSAPAPEARSRSHAGGLGWARPRAGGAGLVGSLGGRGRRGSSIAQGWDAFTADRAVFANAGQTRSAASAFSARDSSGWPRTRSSLRIDTSTCSSSPTPTPTRSYPSTTAPVSPGSAHGAGAWGMAGARPARAARRGRAGTSGLAGSGRPLRQCSAPDGRDHGEYGGRARHARKRRAPLRRQPTPRHRRWPGQAAAAAGRVRSRISTRSNGWPRAAMITDRRGG